MSKLNIPENFRLGYPCINLELRKKNIFSSRTCRLSTLESKGIEYVKDLALKNLKDLQTILEWNLKNNILFFRLSSELFPFASHEKYGYNLEFAETQLKSIGNYAKEHNMRLTMHPAQFNVLSSPNQNVIDNTLRDLSYQCEILDRMGLDQNSVMVVHGGGTYGNKTKSLSRLSENIEKLPDNIRNRLVLENCEMSYSIDDLLPISEKLKIPIVIDYHHDSIYKSSQPVDFYFERVFNIWKERNIKPKVHVSNSIEGVLETDSKTKRRKHSDYISFIHESLYKIEFPIDIMFEAKMKEQAVLQFIKQHKNNIN